NASGGVATFGWFERDRARREFEFQRGLVDKLLRQLRLHCDAELLEVLRLADQVGLSFDELSHRLAVALLRRAELPAEPLHALDEADQLGVDLRCSVGECGGVSVLFLEAPE